MISKEEFAQIGAGDILELQVGDTKMLRTVMSGPRDDNRPKKSMCVCMPIRRRSWTGRITTHQHYNDLKRKIVAVHARSGGCIISPEEAERLADRRFKKKDFFREVCDMGFTAKAVDYKRQTNPFLIKQNE